MNTIAEYDVKVSYEGFEDTFKISVEAASLTELEVVGELANKTFKYGHEIVEADMSGVTIKAVYSDGSKPELSFSQYTVTFDTNNLESTVMTISYGGIITSINRYN